MLVKIKKVRNDLMLPRYAHEDDAGMDMVAVSKTVTPYYIEYGTGIILEVPKNHVGLLFPRSSISKYDLQLCNAVGVVDSGFLDEIKFRFNVIQNSTINANIFENVTGKIGLRDSKIYEVGDKIGQLIILRYPKIVWEVVEEFSETERNKNGFGSSGK